ncbi:hypothetical protein [Labilithrix luteola]|uniref:hypothetical protein n=1 Tax=Labilithrix luteola TaxID=1391654 RepID=UPI001475C855|nr:hypothetical protein [Labilithrix luteola]
MTELALDASRSRVRIQTFAEGLFARLAHDLELVCGELSGSATRTASGTGSAVVSAPLRGIEVGGVVEHGRVDASRLSSSDRRDIVDKMQREVFHAAASSSLTIEATLQGSSARLRITLPNGRRTDASATALLREEDGSVATSGGFSLSLSDIGSDVIKGPMGAFRVKDRVEVVFDLVFTPKG